MQELTLKLNTLIELMNNHFWLSCIIVFILTFLHEIGWVFYIRGIAHKRLPWALLGNAWIISSGVLTTIMVIENLPTIVAAMCGGCLGILTLWSKITKE